MAQQTALSNSALPGVVHVFVAKASAFVPVFTFGVCKMRYLDVALPYQVLNVGAHDRLLALQLARGLDAAPIRNVLDVAQPARTIRCL